MFDIINASIHNIVIFTGYFVFIIIGIFYALKLAMQWAELGDNLFLATRIEDLEARVDRLLEENEYLKTKLLDREE